MWHEVLAWLLAAALAVWTWTKRHRGQLLQAAAECVAFAEKYADPGSTNQQLEDLALGYAREFWPAVPEWAVRATVRELCRRRKVRAQGLVGARR